MGWGLKLGIVFGLGPVIMVWFHLGVTVGLHEIGGGVIVVVKVGVGVSVWVRVGLQVRVGVSVRVEAGTKTCHIYIFQI